MRIKNMKKKVSKKPKKKSAKKSKKAVAKTKKAVVKKPKVGKPKVEKPIGVVTHFYTAIKVAIVKFKKPVKSGTALRVKGATTDFTMTANSMQYDHKPIATAPAGKQIGVKVPKRVREGDEVFASR